MWENRPRLGAKPEELLLLWGQSQDQLIYFAALRVLDSAHESAYVSHQSRSERERRGREELLRNEECQGCSGKEWRKGAYEHLFNVRSSTVVLYSPRRGDGDLLHGLIRNILK